MKISIITPTLNHVKYIEDTVLSIKNQNYSNFEHIIIDGGSTDGTIEILKKYPHLIWISEKDSGQNNAMLCLERQLKPPINLIGITKLKR